MEKVDYQGSSLKYRFCLSKTLSGACTAHTSHKLPGDADVISLSVNSVAKIRLIILIGQKLLGRFYLEELSIPTKWVWDAGCTDE